MKKAKYILGIIALVYAITIGCVWYLCKVNILDKFYTLSIDSFNRTYEYGLQDTDELEKNVISMDVESNFQFQNEKNKVQRFFICDENANIIKRSDYGIVLYENNEGKDYEATVIIDLEKFLSESQKQAIAEFASDIDFFIEIDIFKYYADSDGEIIPTYVVLTEPVGEKKKMTLVLSEDRATDIFLQERESAGRIMAEDDKTLNYHYGTSMTSLDRSRRSGTEKKLYEEIEKQLNFEYVIDAAGVSDMFCYNEDGNKVYYCSKLEKAGKQFFLLGVSAIDVGYELIQNSSFFTYILVISIIYILLAAVSLYITIMLEKRQKKIDTAQRAFIIAAAHELKTPLAIINSHCECLEADVNAEKNSEYIRIIKKEVERMNELIVAFLKYSKASSENKMQMQQDNLSELILAEIDKYYPLFDEKDIIIHEDIEENIYARFNKEYLAVAIDNMLSNAAKYTIKGTSVEVQLNRVGENGFQFSIKNESDGQTKDMNDNSTGMGLFIIDEILKLHNFEPGGRGFGFKSQ